MLRAAEHRHTWQPLPLVPATCALLTQSAPATGTALLHEICCVQAPFAQARTAMCSACKDGPGAKLPNAPPQSRSTPIGSLSGIALSSVQGFTTGSRSGIPAGSPAGIPASSVGCRQLGSTALEDVRRLNGGCAATKHAIEQLLQRQAASGQLQGPMHGLQLERVIGRGSFGVVYEGAALCCMHYAVYGVVECARSSPMPADHARISCRCNAPGNMPTAHCSLPTAHSSLPTAQDASFTSTRAAAAAAAERGSGQLLCMWMSLGLLATASVGVTVPETGCQTRRPLE